MNWLRPLFRSRTPRKPAAARPRRRLSFEPLEDRTTPSTLIPITGARDLVYDDARDLLYVTTNTGRVERYDANAGSLLSSWSVGINLNGADITAAGDSLYVAETAANLIRRVDLSTGAVTNISYADGSGAYDVNVAANGRVFFDSRFAGSGWVTLYSLDPATGTLTGRRSVRQDTGIARGADRSRLFFQEANISNAPTFTYSSATDTFSAVQGSSGFVGNNPAAVSRDGNRVAFQYGGAISILDGEARTVDIAGSGAGGLAFDPTRDLLYAVNPDTDQVVAYDTNTWRERFRVNILADVGAGGLIGNGALALSDDGRYLFLVTTAGVRRIDLPTETGVARTLELSGFPTFIGRGTPGTFTLTARDAQGNVATGYTGTVRFTSTDPAAGLPPTYTFTAADQGSRTFTATFQTAGTQTLTATDVATPALTRSQTGIQVHTNAVSLIPVANRRDSVYDASRGLLYIGTADGRVQRYDVATQTLLAPLTVGVSLRGMDISADNNTLYVAEGQAGANRSILRRVDLTTGQVTNVAYAGLTSGGWDVAVAANGRVFFDSQYPGSGWVDLYALDPATGALTVRRSVNQNSGLYRGADRSLLVGLESNISSGPHFTYSSATDTFLASGGTGTFRGSDLAAVNRNGTLIAMEVGGVVQIRNPNLTLLEALGSVDGGVVFHPTRDLLYAINPTADQVVVYDTNTWAVLNRINIGENVGTSDQFGNGVLTISPDGNRLFLSTNTGVRVITVGQNQAPVLAPVADRTVPSSQATVEVVLSATDPDGDPLTYSATVRSLALVLDQQLGLRTDNGNLYENFFGAGEKWLLSANDEWHILLPNGELRRWDGSGQATGTLVGNVGAAYHAAPELLYNAADAFALDAQFGFFTDGNLYENFFGAGEKWFLDAQNQYYFILPNGDVVRWDGSGAASGTVVASLGAGFHARPELLFNAQNGQVLATVGVSGSQVTITRDTTFAGSLVVTATVSDGQESASRTFTVTVAG